MPVPRRSAIGSPTRRAVVIGTTSVLTTSLFGCGRAPDADGAASAGHSGDRFFFKDAMGWVSADRSGLTLAFLPEQISPEQRDDVVANDGVYPVLAFRQPMLEVHMALSAPQPVPDPDLQPVSTEPRPRTARRQRASDEGLSLTPACVRAVTMTFWNFEEPTPVIEFRQGDDGRLYPVSASGDPKALASPLDLSGFDGLLKRGGWAVGAVRSNALYQSPGNRPEPYYVNLQFETSLG